MWCMHTCVHTCMHVHVRSQCIPVCYDLYTQVLLKTIEEGTAYSTDDVFSLCERLADNKMKFCPGISEEEYAQYHDIL